MYIFKKPTSPAQRGCIAGSYVKKETGD